MDLKSFLLDRPHLAITSNCSAIACVPHFFPNWLFIPQSKEIVSILHRQYFVVSYMNSLYVGSIGRRHSMMEPPLPDFPPPLPPRHALGPMPPPAIPPVPPLPAVDCRILVLDAQLRFVLFKIWQCLCNVMYCNVNIGLCSASGDVSKTIFCKIKLVIPRPRWRPGLPLPRPQTSKSA